MQLRNKSIYITGGTGGIGTFLIQKLRKEGAIIHSFQSNENGGLIENIESVCEYLSAHTPDVLINMAGINMFDYCENQDMKKIIELNLLAPIRLSQAVLSNMKLRRHGHIVNIGSMLSAIPMPYYTGYIAAKAGLRGFSDSLRREVLGYNISITHIMPRAVNTKMNDDVAKEIHKHTNVKYDSAEFVSKRILQAIIHREREVAFGGIEKFYAKLNTILPGLIDMGLRKNILVAERILNKR